MILRTLLCERDVQMAIDFLGGFARLCAEEATFDVHDDGSLSGDSVHRLTSSLPIRRIVSKGTSDELMDRRLSGLPKCSEWRSRNKTMMKILDCVAFEQEDGNEDGKMRFLDADVRFLRPFSGLFGRRDGIDACFMEDIHQAYSVSPRRASTLRGRSLIGRLNCGVIEARVDLASPAKIEALLEDPALTSHPVRAALLEQTLWGLLFGSSTVELYDRIQIALVSPWLSQDERQIAAHFVGPARHRASEWKEIPGEVCSVRTRSADLCGPARYMLDEVFFRSRCLLHRMRRS